MLGLAELVAPPRTAWLAPQAAGHTWYPHRFIEPVEVNEPHLGSALFALDDLLGQVAAGGIPPERIALLGFSQGACLALEFARRRAQRLGAIIGFSGGLIGDTVALPPAGVQPLQGMPVLLGCSERDPHIPIGRVHETDAVMRALGAEVATRVYPGGDHGINEDEVNLARQILARMIGVVPGAA
jgi:predicted esterase